MGGREGGPTEESGGKRTPRPQYLSQRPGQAWDLKTMRYKRLNWWVPGHWSDRKAACALATGEASQGILGEAVLGLSSGRGLLVGLGRPVQATRWTGTSCFKTMRRAQATGHGDNESPGQTEGKREGPRLSIEVPARDTGWTGRSGHPPRALGSLSLTPRGLGAEGAPLPAERWEVVSGQWEVLAPRPGLGGTRGAGRGGAGLPGAGPPLYSPAAAEPQPGLSCFLRCRRTRRRRPPP